MNNPSNGPAGRTRHATAYVPQGYTPPPPGILCAGLYHKLQSTFPGGVLVANLGEAQSGYLGMSTRSGESDRWQVAWWGETYRINCPMCNDTRHRLWINHRYGQPDPANPNRRGNFYGICFNEGCLADPENREWFYDELFRLRNRNEQPADLTVRPGTLTNVQLTDREPPGHVELLTRTGNLPGLGYMVSDRRFNHATLDTYQVQLCLTVTDEKHRLAAGRILFPIYMHGKYVGWQTRYVGEPPSKRIPKYYTCPGMPTRQILYNYDRAKHSPFLVIFEGITDVMRFGDCSVGVLGKRIKHEQVVLIASTWTNNEPIIICLDPDAWEDSALAVYQLEQLVSNPVVPIHMPAEYDPADMDRAPLHNYIRSQVASKGITLPATA